MDILLSMGATFNLPIILGASAAIVHVLAGPDHLAAVTPLVFDTKRKHWKVGFLWGIGHILGMMLIGLLFYFFKDFIPIEKISTYSEQFVGLILIGLGFWAFYRIKNKRKTHKHPHYHETEDKGSIIHIHDHKHPSTAHKHKHDDKVKQSTFTAITVGIIHGFAGIAHFVLLLPVLGFDTKIESISYMIGFAIGVLVAMVTFTFLIGKLNDKHHHHYDKPLVKNFQFWSGVLAIAVGLYWIILNI